LLLQERANSSRLHLGHGACTILPYTLHWVTRGGADITGLRAAPPAGWRGAVLSRGQRESTTITARRTVLQGAMYSWPAGGPAMLYLFSMIFVVLYCLSQGTPQAPRPKAFRQPQHPLCQAARERDLRLQGHGGRAHAPALVARRHRATEAYVPASPGRNCEIVRPCEGGGMRACRGPSGGVHAERLLPALAP